MFDLEQRFELAEGGYEFRALCITALRILGVLTILLASLLAVGQHWEGLYHWQKYSVLLACTAFLSLAGVFCAVKLKESRGARTLLTLTAAVVPIHFCQLGALLFSACYPNPLVRYPEMLRWHASSLPEACLTVAMGLLVLYPLVWFAFRVLIGEGAKTLVACFFGLNALLLIPVRSGDAVAALVLIATLSLSAFYMLLVKGNHRYQTKEGILTLVLMIAPPVGLFLRSLALYPNMVGQILPGGTLACFGLVLFFSVSGMVNDSTFRCLVQRLGAIMYLLGWGLLSVDICADSSWFCSSLIPMVVTIPTALVFQRLALVAGKDSESYFWYACLLVLVGSWSSLMTDASPADMLAGLLVATASTALCGIYSVTREYKALLVISLFIFLWELYRIVMLAFEPIFSGPWWIVLGGVGVGLVLYSSFLEKGKAVDGQGSSANGSVHAILEASSIDSNTVIEGNTVKVR